jgi:hypothetical protein
MRTIGRRNRLPHLDAVTERWDRRFRLSKDELDHVVDFRVYGDGAMPDAWPGGAFYPVERTQGRCAKKHFFEPGNSCGERRLFRPIGDGSWRVAVVVEIVSRCKVDRRGVPGGLRVLAVVDPKSHHLFFSGFTLQISNPKAILFFSALLPQFLNPHAAVVPQVVILGITSVVIEFSILLAYGVAGSSLTPRYARWTNRVAGGLLISAGAGIATR